MSGNDGQGCFVTRDTRTVESIKAEANIKAEVNIKTEANVETCSYCGSRVETDRWHPVVADNDGTGFRIHAFCDERCRKRWRE
ncbi:hypothetical protein ZOD2009_15276 [Haladaptatus paucihalophilus DX253]|uniref:Uncharacterized protein n=1 Tax=Haladaptatus paucihalophilus DX253 TaxID=797209 RepID=E7QW67_HALPU|nr:hypothetical protein ZOD2009_15276 [Haladaptatus paucihalophilus DX253]SHL65175.1 hypothetical protein SAMN05444342_4327 [Haladaptatus paucihalophilus DX253]